MKNPSFIANVHWVARTWSKRGSEGPKAPQQVEQNFNIILVNFMPDQFQCIIQFLTFVSRNTFPPTRTSCMRGRPPKVSPSLWSPSTTFRSGSWMWVASGPNARSGSSVLTPSRRSSSLSPLQSLTRFSWKTGQLEISVQGSSMTLTLKVIDSLSIMASWLNFTGCLLVGICFWSEIGYRLEMLSSFPKAKRSRVPLSFRFCPWPLMCYL